MTVLTGNITMLYCPKCRRTYEEGTQRFCDNDGGRLLPAPSAQKNDSQSKGTFTNLLGKTPTSGETDSKLNSAPRFIPLNKTEESDKKLTSFPSAGRIFQSEQFLKPKTPQPAENEDSILELEPLPKVKAADELLELELDKSPVESQNEPQKPLPRIIKQSEIPSGTALIGDRRTNPAGRRAFHQENPDALLGQTIKGCYLVTEQLAADDEDSLIYLAEDKTDTGKMVIVRVFTNKIFGIDLEEKIFAEERVALSHLRHPNIAGVFDSGALPEGNEFIVSEFVGGKSLAEMLRQTGQFNSLRTARIIRQTSYALSEAHQNGILHRNLKPENIVLTVSEAGIEQVKLMNFGVSHGEVSKADLAYKAPEEIESGVSTFASDIYALAVIAFQMLTLRLPFATESESQLLSAQKEGLAFSPTKLRPDIQPQTDKILEKGLAFKASERYPKARDFGDAFFNALTAVNVWNDDEIELEIADAVEIPKAREFIVLPAINQKDAFAEESPVEDILQIAPRPAIKSENAEISEVKATEDLAWEKRSPDLPQTGSSLRGWLVVGGVVLLLLAGWGLSRLFLNRPGQIETNQTQTNAPANAQTPATATPQDNLATSLDADIKPPPRSVKQPENTQRFQNNRENLDEDPAKNFLGFDIYYPLDWTKSDTNTNFLDIKRALNGVPIEQMIITHYESRGTMTLDRPNFPKLVEKSNQDLKKNLGASYKVLAENETSIQGRWKVYEVKFQSSGKNEKGEDITLWGRRLWLPVQTAGKQNGFVITMLATSLSDVVKSADDVGTQGELAGILETFEPEQY